MRYFIKQKHTAAGIYRNIWRQNRLWLPRGSTGGLMSQPQPAPSVPDIIYEDGDEGREKTDEN